MAGVEAAGVVRSVGLGVSNVSVGDEVAYCSFPGSYAEQAAVPAWRLIKMPDGLSIQDGAAAMLQGMTAHYLCHDTYRVQSGDRVLVHSGAGGVGLLLIQMCKKLGAYVYSTVSTEAKAELARGAGADNVILYTQQDFAAEIAKAPMAPVCKLYSTPLARTPLTRAWPAWRPAVIWFFTVRPAAPCHRSTPSPRQRFQVPHQARPR